MNRARNLLLSLTLILTAAVTVRADGVDDWVKAQMELRHIPAASIAVIKDGVVVKTAGYGIADLEHNIPARPDTVFKIGSVSKQFIAAGVMVLVQDGKIAVDDKISKYLQGTPATWQAITLRHLLTHTSGLVREGPGFDPYKIQPDIDGITVIVLTNLERAALDNLTSGIAVRYVPALLPAYLKRWPATEPK